MTRSFAAVRWHAANDLRLDLLPLRDPGPGEVRIRPAYVGICGSDLHEVVDGPHAIPVDRPHGLSGATAPLVLGHEFSGVVDRVGPGVRGWGEGDPVAVEPNYRCGVCRACGEGSYHVCARFGFAGLMGDGGMAEYAVVPAYMLQRLPTGFDLAAAAVLEPAAVALHAVRRAEMRPGTRAVVVGLGPVGLLVSALLVRRGVEVVGVEPARSRGDLALRFGVHAVVDPGQDHDVREEVRRALGTGADVAFEVVGRQESFDVAMGSVRSGGTVMLLGLTGRLHFDAFAAVNDELTIRASVGYNDCHGELIDLVAGGHLDLSAFTRDVVSLRDAPGVLTDLAAGRASSLKTLVDCASEPG